MNIQNAQALIKTLKETQAKPLSDFESSGFFSFDDNNSSPQQAKDAAIEKLIIMIDWALDDKSPEEMAA